MPITQVSTPLYFDFPTPICARELTFELVGDITAYTDVGDVVFKDPPMATGLSLANKIKAYRYVPISEMGKWAILSAV